MIDEVDLAELFHENSKARTELGLPPGAIPGGESFPLELMDASIKLYPTRPVIALPPGAGQAHVDLCEGIRRRSSARAYGEQPVSLEQLAQILFHGTGIKEVPADDGYRDYRRNAPSAGNLGSVDLYPLVLNVAGVPSGVYHYQPVDHQLTVIAGPEALPQLEHCQLQPEFSTAAVLVALGSSLGRVRAKYGIRGYRYACIDAGHAAQNLCLVASALGLGACTVGGFDDDILNDVLDLDGVNESALYLVAVGTEEI